MRIGAPEAEPGEAHRQVGAPVKPVLEGEEFAPPGGDLRQQDRPFVGLGPAVAEEAFLQAARGDLSELFGKFDDRLSQVDVADMLQGLHLFADTLGDFRVAVAGVDHRDTGEEVEVLFPLMVVEVLHFAPDDLHRFLVEVVETGNDVLLFLFDDFLWAEILSRHRFSTPD